MTVVCSYPVALLLKKGTDAHVAFSDWHEFRSHADFECAKDTRFRSLFCFTDIREITSSLYKVTREARFPDHSFCTLSFYWGAVATSYANDLFAGKSIEEAMANTKNRLSFGINQKCFAS